MNSTDYLGLKADYALETQIGGRRFGTIEVIFNSTIASFTDNSTRDVPTNGTQGDEFAVQVQSGELEVLFGAFGGHGSVDLAMSFKLIAVP